MSLVKEILSLKLLIPSRHLPAQSQQQKHQNKTPTMPTADNKDTGTTPMTSPWCLHYQSRARPTHRSSASIANPEHAIAGWVFTVKTNIVKLSNCSKQ